MKGALLDLRTLYLVPVGAQPKTPALPDEKPLAPAELAQIILDDATPKDRREATREAGARPGPRGDSRDDRRSPGE